MVRAGLDNRIKAIRRVMSAASTVFLAAGGVHALAQTTPDSGTIRIAWSDRVGAEVFARSNEWCADEVTLDLTLTAGSPILSSTPARDNFEASLRRVLSTECPQIERADLIETTAGLPGETTRTLQFANRLDFTDLETVAGITADDGETRQAASIPAGSSAAERSEPASLTETYHANRRVRTQFPETLTVQPAALNAIDPSAAEQRLPIDVLAGLTYRHTKKTSGRLRSAFLRDELDRTLDCALGEPRHGRTAEADADIERKSSALTVQISTSVIPDGDDRYLFEPFAKPIIWSLPQLASYCPSPKQLSMVRAVTATFDEPELMTEFVPTPDRARAWNFRINAQGGDVAVDVTSTVDRVDLVDGVLSLSLSPVSLVARHSSGNELISVDAEWFTARRAELVAERQARAQAISAEIADTLTSLKRSDLSRPARLAFAFHGYDGEGVPPTPHPADAAAQASLFGEPVEGYFMFRVSELDGAHAIANEPIPMRIVPATAEAFRLGGWYIGYGGLSENAASDRAKSRILSSRLMADWIYACDQAYCAEADDGQRLEAAVRARLGTQATTEALSGEMAGGRL